MNFAAVTCVRHVIMVLTCVALWACGRADRSTPTADTVVAQSGGRNNADTGGVFTVPPPDSVDTTAAWRTLDFPQPASILVADSVAGQRVYRRVASCIACHGAQGEGVAGLGSPINDQEWKHGDGSLAFLYHAIREGISEAGGGRVLMPASRQLSTRELFQMAAFVYASSHPGRTVADSASLPAGAPPIAHPPADTLRRQ